MRSSSSSSRWALNSSSPRRGSCTCEKAERVLTFSAFIIAGCVAAAPATNTSRSLLAGPHARRCSTLASASVNSRRASDSCCQSNKFVRELNQFLRGWVGYFRYGNSTKAFDKIRLHAVNRLALFVAKRRGRSVRWGWAIVVHQSPDCIGLFNPNGTVVAPRPIWGWREKPNAIGERRR
ncbi:MAG: group II intron maturase-specific domain-containing protein [Solirubrobacterales bacterium]